MANKIWTKFSKCAIIATKKEDQRTFRLGAIAERGDGAIVSACNGPTQRPRRQAHAEYRLSKMLDYGATIYVARVLKSGAFGCAMPCSSCFKALKSKRVKKIYFTIDNTNYGVIPVSGS